MRHALGLDQAAVAYRNRYIASYNREWEALIDEGLAHRMPAETQIVDGKISFLSGAFYYVSAAGMDALNVKDRSGLEGYELGGAPDTERAA